MGGWDIVIVFLTYAALASTTKAVYLKEMGNSNLNPDLIHLYKSIPLSTQVISDQVGVESNGPLFNNIYWASPTKLDPRVESEHSTLSRNNSKNSELTDNANKINNQDYVVHYHDHSGSQYNDINKEALEQQAEAFVERQFQMQQETSNRNRRKIVDERTVTNLKPSESPRRNDNQVASSDYGYPQYQSYDDDYHKQEYHPKKKEIHYHQHKHLHEHEHQQDHKHQHNNEHKEDHHHDHKQHAEHKHQHHAKHEHDHKAHHQHKIYSEHKHDHREDHKHDHKEDHKHDHYQQHKHDHWAKHEHKHKEDERHMHELKHQHEHEHHHDHKQNAKHSHNHWSDHKHWHNHNQKHKHYHDHKDDHYHKHKEQEKKIVKYYYKKGHNYGW